MDKIPYDALGLKPIEMKLDLCSKSDSVSSQEAKEMLGAEPASALMQQRLKEVEGEYKKRELLSRFQTFKLFYLNEKGIDRLQGQGHPVFMNATHHKKNIWVTADHDSLDSDLSKFQLAHEVAHHLVDSNKTVNPQRLFHELTLPVLVGGLSSSVLCLGKAAYNEMHRKPVTKPAILGLLTFSSGLVFSGVSPSAPKMNELVCDLTAAKVMPNGYHHGVRFFEQVLEKNRYDETSKDHPKLSTRILVLKVAGKWNQFVDKIKTYLQ